MLKLLWFKLAWKLNSVKEMHEVNWQKTPAQSPYPIYRKNVSEFTISNNRNPDLWTQQE